jgi:hypothetical protein
MKGRHVGCGLAVGLGVALGASEASAFCGFYVGGADTKLFNDATQVVLMRDGTRTVLTMQNDYKGPPEDFALVVPVPVILQKENVKTLSSEVFDHIDKLTAPRLVEYWEQDPCAVGDIGTLGHGAGTGTGQGFGNGHGRLGGAHGVTVEAQFAVGEYQILILSAKDSTGLDTWLRENKYKIPDGAADALKPYVEGGSKFFVAKVDAKKVIKDGHAALSPLRFHYDAERLELPVKLGLLNSAGTQDLIVYILGPDRYEVANYPNVAIPTNLDLTEAARTSFGGFYASLYDHTLEQHPSSVVTEYAWQAGSCDPCPGDMKGLSARDVAALGGDVEPTMTVRASGTGVTLRQGATQVTGQLPPEVIQRIVRQNFGRFRLCYENGLRSNPNLSGRVNVSFSIDGTGSVTEVKDGGSDLPDSSVVTCVVHGFEKLSFPEPENKKPVKVVYPIIFNAEGAPEDAPAIVTTSKGSLVVTRLHARYGKGALGSDLVFKVAEPIVGGRETIGADGKLEHGSKPTTDVSSFQARYAIRHSWTGPIACEQPRRGVWGGPWPDAGAAPDLASATKLGLQPHGGVDFASLTKAEVASTALGDAGAMASPDAGAEPAKPASKCGCDAVGAKTDPSGGFGALLLGMLALARAARKR